MKIKKFELELADDFSDKPIGNKGRHDWPYYKRWRVWANGVNLGDIIKTKDPKTKEASYKIYLYKAEIGDIFSYLRTDTNKGVKFTYMKDGVPGKKDNRKSEGYKTLSEAVEAFKKRFLDNILHLVEL